MQQTKYAPECWNIETIMRMKIAENNIITIVYELRENNAEGELMERVNVNYPFTFMFGTGALLPAFEAHLEGLGEDGVFEFVLPFKEAYGKKEEGNIIEVPRVVFQIEGAEPPNLVTKDNFIALTDEGGMTHHGKILDFDRHKVKVDFNHVMAGKNLHFKGAVLSIRKATVDELIKQHYIPTGGVRKN